MSASIPAVSPATFVVPASSRIATYSLSLYTVNQVDGDGTRRTPLFNGAGGFTSAAFTAPTRIELTSGSNPTFYSVGTAAFNQENPTQPTPGALNATGTLTAALVFGGIVTSTTAAAVTATLDTGTIFDAASTFAVNDYVDWSAINTGGTNAFTVTASAGHTLSGNGVVAANTTGRFRTVKTAANTFVTHRLS